MNKVKEKITVKLDDLNPEPIELIAKSIIDVAEAFQKINNSKLKKRAIVLLLQDSIGSTNITRTQIELVLEHAPKLKDIYLK